MSLSAIVKVILYLVIITSAALFIYFKFQINGDPNSSFNQNTRFVLGKQFFVRTLFGLHNEGDARAEYLGNPGQLVIEWFKPGTEDVDVGTLAAFGDLAGKYTGRQAQVVYGGAISEGTVDLQGLGNLGIKGPGKPSGSDILYVVFAADYQPRQAQELATTRGENTVVISLNAHRQFVGDYSQNLNKYLLSSLLHEFGHEIGLSHNSDPACIMDEHASIQDLPLESSGLPVPQDFCPAEINQINLLQTQF